MFEDVSLDTRNADEMSKYIIGGSGSHPNVACCREFYIPKIVGALEALLKDKPEPPDINTDALKALIERADGLNENDYTETSWAVLQTGLTNAKTVLANVDTTQQEIDAAAKAIEDAIKALVDISELRAAVTDATERMAELKQADYTADSWAALEDALKDAQTILANENATQSAVDNAEKALEDTLEALVKASSGPSGSSGPSTPSMPGSGTTSSSVTTDTTAQGGNTSTETTAKPNASASGNSASSSVSGSMGDEIVKQAESNNSDSVVIEPDMPGNVTKADVTIPGSTLSQLGKKTDADVTVKTPAGSVTIPNGALENLGSAGNSVTVSVENKVDNTTSVDVKVDGKSVETVSGGVKATLPVKDGQVAVLVDADGNETIIQKSLVEGGTAYVVLDGSATVKIVDNRKIFSDVSDSSWYSDAVTFASSHELFNGTGDGSTFAPNSNMTRAMLATVLWRLESEADAGQGAVDFADTVSGSWYADGVAWASAEGIVQGTGGNNFSPNNSITREQLATMLYRYAVNRGLDTGKRANLSGYTDGANVSGWAGDAMQWAVAVGLIQGKGTGILDAGGTATRAEVATILQRLVGLLVK